MKKRIMMLLVVGLFAFDSEAKEKKNKKSGISGHAGSGHQSAGQGIAQQLGGVPSGSVVPNVSAPVVAGQPVSDQQFLQDQLLGMQRTEITELKSKIMAMKAKNAENKKIIDQALSELVSGPVILYKR